VRALPRAVLCLSAGCGGFSPAQPAAPGSSSGPSSAAIAPEFVPALQVLESALAAGADELARRVLAGIQARAPTGPARERARAAQRVLTGRELARAIDARLESEPAPSGQERVLLVLENSRDEPLQLCFPPVSLELTATAIDAEGVETQNQASQLVGALAELTLGPHARRRVELARHAAPSGSALALRERWRLVVRAGEIQSGGESYPAAGLTVHVLERTRVSSALEARVVTAEELARALRGDPALSRPAFLALAVRVPTDQRLAALRALAPLVHDLAHARPESAAALIPGLAWLARTRQPGVDPVAWARSLSVLAEEPPSEARAPSLDLPERAPLSSDG
jgi:hypothetical protein